MTPTVSFSHVTRRFGRVTALDRIDLQIEPGTILGLAGRNAAGKTTLLRMAAGLIWPDQGTVRVCGLNPVTDRERLAARVSLMDEESTLYPRLTIGELTKYAARLHPRWDDALAANVSQRLSLDPTATINSLSRGTRAKVALMLAVAPRPELLMLDDPTSGIDPLARREILDGVLATIPEQGGVVIWASHLIQDLERVADRIAVIDAGRLILDESIDALGSQMHRADAVFAGEPPPRLNRPGWLRAERDGRMLRVIARCGAQELRASLNSAGAQHLEISKVNLEDLLIEYLRPQAATAIEQEVTHV
jgi:ABC-2 type transport system ATP-binding protein